MTFNWHIALLRGINVGRAKRVAMSDLRALVSGLGYGNVRTLLNSGNVCSLPQPRPRATPRPESRTRWRRSSESPLE